MNAETKCPCSVVVFPRSVFNPSGLDSLDYRIGDYLGFRDALLRARPGEKALAEWRPTAQGDLGIQLLEWWAYLADVLTFYNEQAIQEAFLRTAKRPEDVRRIIRLLGYRPRPGIGATGVVAAIADSTRSFVVPRGFRIQGTPPPGGVEQVFEVDTDVEIGRLGRPLPPSARMPSPAPLEGSEGIDDTTGSLGWVGDAPRDALGRIVNSGPVRASREDTQIEIGQTFQFALEGVVTTAKPDDVLLVLPRSWPDSPAYALASVRTVEHTWDSQGKATTLLTLLAGDSLGMTNWKENRLLRPTKLAHLWLYHQRFAGQSGVDVGSIVEQIVFFNPFDFGSSQPIEDPSVLTGRVSIPANASYGAAHLEAITRGISAGDPVLFEQRNDGGILGFFANVLNAMMPGPVGIVTKMLVEVLGYTEEIWYANAPQANLYGKGPPVAPPQASGGGLLGSIFGAGEAEAPIPIPHSKITFSETAIGALASGGLDSIVVHYGWQEVGRLVEPPAPGQTTTVEVSTIEGVPPEVPVPVLVEDVTGAGTPGHLGRTGIGPGPVGEIPREHSPLIPPLRALLHLLAVSRGQTVPREVLGSGDPILRGQQFVLKRTPLTYLADTGPDSTDGYRSTLRVRVDGIEWQEVRSFYGQPADAHVFVTREDEEQRTHVTFGDGENGMRLPAGVDNVVAAYRYGSGATLPEPRSLTKILRPIPGLQSLRNPIPVGGGADPDPPERIRKYAPGSVMTFGRAVSRDDFQTVAAQTPGVARARAYWSWDTPSQRALVKVLVGDDEAAAVAARAALKAFSDPNLPVIVELAIAQPLSVSLIVQVDPAYDPQDVWQAVRAALLDPDRQPFGHNVVQIGQVVYDSHVSAACLCVPGVVAIRGLQFKSDGVSLFGERHVPPEGGFFLLSEERLRVSPEVARHGR